MKLVTLTDYLGRKFGDEAAVDMIAKAGFDGLDYSAFHMLDDDSLLNRPDYVEYAEKIRKRADENGIKFFQAHAPFPSSDDDENFNSVIKERIIRSMEAAAIMGAEIIVVHPVQHLSYVANKSKLYEMNMKFYRELIPYCEKFGIKVAVENMFHFDANRKVMCDSVCASPYEFSKYIDDLDSPYITGCLDIGHCGLCGREPQDMLRIMGADRVGALHIHDNDYMNDKHTLPCTMSLNWDEICHALADIGYRGNFTYEADSFLSHYDDIFLPCALKFMHDTGRYLIGKIEKYKNEKV